MNNCEKKLDALIDALGFSVEEVVGDVLMVRYSGRDVYNKQVVDYKLTKRKTTPVDVDIAKLVISWWEDEPWAILPENVTFNARPDFVIKAYEVINEEI